jgi:two-component system sensor histidine kinase ChiS
MQRRFYRFGFPLLGLLLALWLEIFVPMPARSTQSDAVMNLAEGWWLRWGNSPTNDAGEHAWLINPGETSEWHQIKLPGEYRALPLQRNSWLRVQLPDKIWQNPGLFIWRIDGVLEAYLDDKKIYQFGEIKQGPLADPGNPFHLIPLGDAYKGRVLSLRVASHSPRLGVFGDVKIGNQTDLIVGFLRQNVGRLFIGFASVLLGLALLAFNFGKKDERAYRSLALFCFCIGIWYPSWAKVHQVFFEAPLAMKYVEYAALLLAPVGIIAYIEDVFGAGPRKILRRIWQLDLIYSFCALGGVALGAFPFSALMAPFHVLIALNFIFAMGPILQRVYSGEKNAILFTVGFGILGLTMFRDIAVSSGLIPWLPTLSHWGVFAFMICLTIILVRRFSELHENLSESQQELVKKNEALKHLDKLKDEFLAGTSHELRTPLHGIIGIAESLLSGTAGEITKKQENNLGMIVQSGKRLSHLINDLLDFSKLKHGNVPLVLEPISLASMTDNALSLLKPLTKNKSLELVSLLNEQTHIVMADKERLTQILHNLIGNAIKFTEKGRIEISAEIQADFLCISISDTGLGIPEDRLGDIFKPFEQVDGSISKKYGGTGLGLPITKNLVERHGGKIEVHSKQGQGSLFSFTLLLAPRIAKPSPQPEELNRIPWNLEWARKETTLLIVDDELSESNVLEDLFKGSGCTILRALNAEETLECMASHDKPDLLLLNVTAPDSDGFNICRQLRVNYAPTELPILFLTACEKPEDRIEAFRAGGNDCLQKPFSQSELLSRISSQLKICRLHESLKTANKKMEVLLRATHKLLDRQTREDMVTTFFAALAQAFSMPEKMAIVFCSQQMIAGRDPIWLRRKATLTRSPDGQTTLKWAKKELLKGNPLTQIHLQLATPFTQEDDILIQDDRVIVPFCSAGNTLAVLAFPYRETFVLDEEGKTYLEMLCQSMVGALLRKERNENLRTLKDLDSIQPLQTSSPPFTKRCPLEREISQTSQFIKRRCKILVVDDEEINQQVIENYLSSENTSIQKANNGTECLESVRRDKPDIVLLDLMMPGISGIETCLKLREKYRAEELPILLVTASSSPEDVMHAFAAGANDYILKPFERLELIARIKHHGALADYIQFQKLAKESLNSLVQTVRELMQMHERLPTALCGVNAILTKIPRTQPIACDFFILASDEEGEGYLHYTFPFKHEPPFGTPLCESLEPDIFELEEVGTLTHKQLLQLIEGTQEASSAQQRLVLPLEREHRLLGTIVVHGIEEGNLLQMERDCIAIVVQALELALEQISAKEHEMAQNCEGRLAVRKAEGSDAPI